jgi:hypothetical protein
VSSKFLSVRHFHWNDRQVRLHIRVINRTGTIVIPRTIPDGIKEDPADSGTIVYGMKVLLSILRRVLNRSVIRSASTGRLHDRDQLIGLPDSTESLGHGIPSPLSQPLVN